MLYVIFSCKRTRITKDFAWKKVRTKAEEIACYELPNSQDSIP